MAKVLLTGGNGFIASHILDILLKRGYDVVTTVRSQDRGEKILERYPHVPSEQLSYVVVSDIAQVGAMDQAVRSTPPFDAVIHTASPFTQKWDDPVKDILEPALKGTVGTLESIKNHAPTVRRVIVLSSFAALINYISPPKVYDETSWNPVTWDAAVSNPRLTYPGSKTLAEKAAWDFIQTRSPSFDLVTINPPLVFGPTIHFVPGLDRLNTSNQRIRDLVQGTYRDTPLPPTGVYLWVDVRDVAEAHVRALKTPEAGGHRFLLTAGYFSNKNLADVISTTHPELKDRLPRDAVDDTPADVYGFDNEKAKRVLGVTYRSLEESVRVTVSSILEIADRS